MAGAPAAQQPKEGEGADGVRREELLSLRQKRRQARAAGQGAEEDGSGDGPGPALRPTKAGAQVPVYPPSRIVLLRRVNWDVTQTILHDFGQRFGEVVRVIMLRSKNHALIEFASLECARSMVEYYRSNFDSMVDLQGNPVTIGYCKHQRWVAPEASKTLLASLFDSDHHITECIFISPRLVYQLFAPYGAIEALVVLPKKAAKNRVQTLVQFVNADHARHVKELLQGLPVWFGNRTQLAIDLLYAKVDSISCRLLPSSTLVVPREFVEVHREMIDKYGSLIEAFGLPANQLSLEQLADAKRYADIARKHAHIQRAMLVPAMRALRVRVDQGELPLERLREGSEITDVLAALHRPVVEDWNHAKGVTPAEQQATMQRMEMLIHNGGMAATCRLVPRGGDDGDDSDEQDMVLSPHPLLQGEASASRRADQAMAAAIALADEDRALPLAHSAPAVLSKLLRGRGGAGVAEAALRAHVDTIKALVTPLAGELVVNPNATAAGRAEVGASRDRSPPGPASGTGSPQRLACSRDNSPNWDGLAAAGGMDASFAVGDINYAQTCPPYMMAEDGSVLQGPLWRRSGEEEERKPDNDDDGYVST